MTIFDVKPLWPRRVAVIPFAVVSFAAIIVIDAVGHLIDYFYEAREDCEEIWEFGVKVAWRKDE
ncbi:MAG: hypothetical protein UR84_C0024G0002 [candidate division WS6 bacterium GW2011_GWD1_35_594]|nr:MAG: hypothetical protein UR84_C0024G0002 [candidate division WS6 bacterium GW2011_GWD1_35_594]